MLDVCSRFYLFVESIILRLRERCALRVRVQVCALLVAAVATSACSPKLIGNVKISKGITTTSSSTVGAVALTLSGPASVTAGVCSTAFTVTTVDATPSPVVVASNTTITMAGLCAGSLFSDSGCTAGLSPVVIASGQSSKIFYFKSTVAASHTIGVSSGTLVTASSALTVNAAGAVVANSTIAGVPSTGIAADGVSTSTVTVTLRDTYNNVVPGATVTFASTGTGNTIVQPAVVSNASGVATGTLASTVAEAKTISISAPAGLGAVTNTVTFIASSVSVANSTISSTTPVIADGVATSTVTITLLDGSSNPVSGVTPTLAVGGTCNTVNACSASDVSGVSTCTITSTKAETKSVAIATPISKAGNNVVFTHGTATKLVYTTQPAGAVSGVAFTTQPVIEIRDANDNVVTTGADATRVITISKQTGTGTLSGTLTKTAVAGVADFVGLGLSIDLQGSKTLRASATLNAVGKTVDSSAFVVDPIACDTGNLSTTCTISTLHTIPAGVDIAGTGNLVVASGGTIQNLNNTQDITITMTGNVTVQSGGTINANVWPLSAANVDVQSGAVVKADGLGFRGGRQTGWAFDDGEGTGGGVQAGGAPYSAGGGGGHGGAGGRTTQVAGTGGIAYGSNTLPVTYGSGGAAGCPSGTGAPGGNGGGRLKIIATTLVTVDGSLRSNGNGAASANTECAPGGGAGGSIQILATTVNGSGVISAQGETHRHWGYPTTGFYGGGGGGGRIRIQSDKLFTGSVQYAAGRSPIETAAAAQGTFIHDLPTVDAFCDSGTLAGGCTISTVKNVSQNLLTQTFGGALTITSAGVLKNLSRNDWFDFTIAGALTLDGTIQANVARLIAPSAALSSTALVVGNQGGKVSGSAPGWTIAGAMTIASGAAMSADGYGYAGSNSAENSSILGWGPGPGLCGTVGETAGGGGGYGGAGGNASIAGGTGGASYGSAIDPSDYGSGGGCSYGYGSYGFGPDTAGNGGGLIRLNVGGTFTNNGDVTAMGITPPGEGGGGGAGGSIKVVAAAFAGTGSVRARGGAGISYSANKGGGGGGRILLQRSSGSTFGGTVTVTGGAAGGVGATAGSAGTIVQAPDAADATQSTITGTGSVVADDTATSTITITLKDVNGFGVFGVTPTFTATDTGATNTKTACSVSNASGVSTCTLKSRKAEVKTLAIATPVVSTGGTVTFTNGAASQIAFTTQPPETKVNAAMSGGPVVTIQDQYGNTVTTGADATRTITIAKQTGTGTLSGTLTKVAVAGVATFAGNSLAIDALGAKTLRASTTLTAGGVTVDSASFDITVIRCDSGSLATTCTLSSADTIPNGVAVTGANLTIANGGALTNAQNAVASVITLTGSLVVQNGGTLSANLNKLTATTVDVQTGGTISADSLGYRGGRDNGYAFDNGEGPGGGVASSANDFGGGGGHIGAGGIGSGAASVGGIANDNEANPIDYGSGGSSSHNGAHAGYPGGGLIWIEATTSITVNGTISANSVALNYEGAVGAGGTVRLKAPSVAGTGLLSARANNIGAAWNRTGGGGGGAVYVEANRPFGGSVQVEGGNTSAAFATSTNRNGARGKYRLVIPSVDAICDSGTWAGGCTISSPVTIGDNHTSLSGSALAITSSGVLSVANLRNPIALALSGNLSIAGTTNASFTSLTANDVTISGTLNGNLGGETYATQPGLSAATLTITSSGVMSADGMGQLGAGSNGNELYVGQGTGAGTTNGGLTKSSGGGYGGAGGSGSGGTPAGGMTYGSSSDPTHLGSGGGGFQPLGGPYKGGDGGGLLRATLTGAFSNAGVISASGVNGWEGGGGSGGSIKIRANTVAGAGIVRANGGQSQAGWAASGGGGGGRVAIIRDAGSAFSGTLSVSGGAAGGSGASGTAGTLYQAKTGAITLKNKVYLNPYVAGTNPTFDCMGGDYLLVVMNDIFGTMGPPTYGGAAMTYIDSWTDGNYRGGLYGLVAPAAGANTFSLGGSPSNPAAWLLCFSNVNQSSPTGALATSQSTSTTPSTSASSQSGDLVIDFVMGETPSATVAVNASQSEQFNTAFYGSGLDWIVGISTKAGDTNVSMDWTFSASIPYFHRAISLRSAGGPVAQKIAVTLTNAGGALTNYPVMLTNAYLNQSDVHFYDSDQVTPLEYWVETAGTVWVKVPSIPNGSKTIYAKYSDGYSSTANGPNTFDFFDDFSGSSLDTSKWTAFNVSAPSFASGIMSTAASGADPEKLIATAASSSDYYVMRARVQVTGGTNTDERIGVGTKTSTTDGRGYNYAFYDFTNLDEVSFLSDSVSWYARASAWTKNAWNVIEAYSTSGNTMYGRLNNGSWSSQASCCRAGTGYPSLNVGSFNATAQWDWALVYQYSASPPTIAIAAPTNW